jgi:hypothetical protein
MPLTTTSSLTNSLPYLLAEVKFTRQYEAVMPKLVDTVQLPPYSGSTYNIPKLGTINAYSLVEGVDMAQFQALSDSKITFTPAEVGCQVFITDRVAYRVTPGLMRRAGSVMGNAMAKKEDQDLLGQFALFGRGLGGSGQTLLPGVLMAARARVRANVQFSGATNEPAPDPIYCVLHDYQWYDIAADILGFVTPGSGGKFTSTSFANASDLPIQAGVMNDYYVGSMYGMKIFVDDNIPLTGTDAYGAVFSQQAIVLVEEQGEKMEPQRDASLRGTELNLVSSYGWGVYLDQWGHYILSDVTAPTG